MSCVRVLDARFPGLVWGCGLGGSGPRECRRVKDKQGESIRRLCNKEKGQTQSNGRRLVDRFIAFNQSNCCLGVCGVCV